MAFRLVGNKFVNTNDPQFQLYNAIGRNEGAANNDNFFAKRGSSIENAFGTTGAALYETGGNLLPAVVAGLTGGDYTSHRSRLQNEKTDRLLKENEGKMSDIYKKYGYANADDYYNQSEREMNEIFGRYGVNDAGDYWSRRYDAGNDSAAVAAIDKEREDLISRMNEQDAARARYFDNIQRELIGQSNSNVNTMRQNAANYNDYVNNNYASQKINQDRGKFLGSAINTLSTGVDVLLPGYGVALNAAQGGIEGIADELEQNGLQNFDWGRAGQNAGIGAVTGGVVGGMNKGINNALAKNGGRLFAGNNALARGINKIGSIPGPQNLLGKYGGTAGRFAENAINTVGRGALRGALSGAAGGATGAGLYAATNNGDVIGSALQGAVRGAQQGALAGGVMSGANMALSKAPLMRSINQAGVDWQNSGDNFNQRLTNTLNSGKSAVGNWLNGKPSRVIGAAGNIGNRVQDIETGNIRYNKARDLAKRALDEFEKAAPYDFEESMWEMADSEGIDWNTANGRRAFIEKWLDSTANDIVNGGDLRETWAQSLEGYIGEPQLENGVNPITGGTVNNGNLQKLVAEIRGFDNTESPTTVGGWLKKAGQRIVEDANNKGVGLSVKDVSDDNGLDLSGKQRVNGDTMSEQNATLEQEAPSIEKGYYSVIKKVDPKWQLDTKLYDAGHDDLRYALQSLEGQYGALLHGEVTSKQYAQEYVNEIKNSVAEVRAELNKLSDRGAASYKNKIGQIVDFIENNVDNTYAQNYGGQPQNSPRVLSVSGKDEQYTFASDDNTPQAIKQAALDYAYETDGRVDPSELTEFYNAAQKFEGDIHSLAEQYSMETGGRIDPNEYVDFMMQKNTKAPINLPAYQDMDRDAFDRMYANDVKFKKVVDDWAKDVGMSPADALSYSETWDDIRAGYNQDVNAQTSRLSASMNPESPFYNEMTRGLVDNESYAKGYLGENPTDSSTKSYTESSKFINRVLDGDLKPKTDADIVTEFGKLSPQAQQDVLARGRNWFNDDFLNTLNGSQTQSYDQALNKGLDKGLSGPELGDELAPYSGLPKKVSANDLYNLAQKDSDLRKAVSFVAAQLADDGETPTYNTVAKDHWDEVRAQYAQAQNYEGPGDYFDGAGIGDYTMPRPETEVYRAVTGETPEDINTAFDTKGSNTFKKQNKAQVLGQRLQNAAKKQKYSALFDALDEKTALRATDTNAPEKLSQLGFEPENYGEFAKTSNYINEVVDDLAKKSGIKVNLPDLPTELSPENIDVALTDDGVRKYNDYIKQIVADGDSPTQYSATELLNKSRWLGNKAEKIAKTATGADVAKALKQAKYILRDHASEALDNAGVFGDATDDNVAAGLAKLGFDEKVQDYYTNAIEGKSPTAGDLIRRSSLAEQARDMYSEMGKTKFRTSASHTSTNPLTQLYRSSGLEEPMNAVLRSTVAPVAGGLTKGAGKALEAVGNVYAKATGGEPTAKAPKTAQKTQAAAPEYNPATQLYNAIGRTEGSINAKEPEATSAADYIAAASAETSEAPTSATSLYNSVTNTTANPSDWTSVLSSAMRMAMAAGDSAAFGQLYAMYQDANSKKQSTENVKLSDKQRQANAAARALDDFENVRPNFGYDVSDIPLVGGIVNLGGNEYASKAEALALQIGYMLSGATVNKEEAQKIGMAYIPRPRDTEAVRKAKLAQLRGIIADYQQTYAK